MHARSCSQASFCLPHTSSPRANLGPIRVPMLHGHHQLSRNQVRCYAASKGKKSLSRSHYFQIHAMILSKASFFLTQSLYIPPSHGPWPWPLKEPTTTGEPSLLYAVKQGIEKAKLLNDIPRSRKHQNIKKGKTKKKNK